MIERFTLLSALEPITFFRKHIKAMLFLLCFMPSYVFAQPANDDCANAATVTDLSGGCNNFNFVGATADLLNGNCAANGTNSLNTWYQFTAAGSELEITSAAQGGAMEITVIEFATNCVFAGAIQIECSLSPLTATGLTPGNNYYIIISDPTNGSTGNYNLCVTSQAPNPPPPNDDPCDAQFVTANGSCTSGTTVDATTDWTIGDPACTGLEENTVWYTTTIGPDMDQLDVEIQGAGGNVMAIVGTFAPDCNGTFSVNDYYCGNAGGTPFTATGLTENTQYWVLVSTSTLDEGTFDVCLTEDGLPPGCSDNNFCVDATPYPTPTTGVACTPLNGCNIGADPEPSLTGCSFDTEEVVWFSFTSDATAGLLSASVVANDPTAMSQPSIQIFTGGCGGLTEISDCATGSNGQVLLVNETIAPNSNYLVAVSNGFGDGGFFDLCLQTFADLSACATESDLYVQPGSPSFGSPDNGPYQPGEVVTLCFDLINYHADPGGVGNNCQWLQGIVPIFGDCWDPSGFDPAASAPPGLYGGNWDWHTNITYNTTNPNITIADCDGDGDTDICHITEPGCCNTGTTAGTVLPPGWFADMGGSPNNTFGDGNCCNCDMGPWEFCFNLTTKQYPECDADPTFTDCSVKIYTFADGETGSWNGGPSICAQDVPQINNASLNCCEGPTIDYQEATVCNGGALFFNLTSNQDPNVDYSWTVSPPGTPAAPNQYGGFDGMGGSINQTLTNNTGSPVVLTYSVSGANTTEGCVGTPVDFQVTILPSLEVDIPNVLPVCAGECADIQATASGGSGNYVSYVWDQGIPAGSSSANVCPTATTTYSVTVTDDLGCSGEASVEVAANSGLIISIDAIPGAESCINLDNPATATATVTQGGSGNYSYQWESALNGFGGNAETEVVFDTDTYTVTITDGTTGCTGEQSIDMTIHPLPVIIIIDPPTLCESVAQYDFDVFVDGEGLGGSGAWGGVADINGSVFPVDLGAGMHEVTYEFTNENSCYDIQSYFFTVDPLPAAPAALPDVDVCSTSGPQDYSIPVVPGAFTYTWTVPADATITTGQGSTGITVDWTGSVGGQVCVTADNDCGASPSSCFDATIGNPPAVPVAPADFSFCANDPVQTFMVTNDLDADTYNWVVPAGVTITTGTGTNEITVNWGTAGGGQVCVSASNTCGASAQDCTTVTILDVPAAPTPPADATICAGATGQVYTITAVATATGYTWTVPAGATITGGQNTTALTVDWATNATSGEICVTADNDCGSSTPPACFDITIGTIPDTPTPPANSTVCANDMNVAYSVTAVQFADDYTWTVPTGATIASGINTNAITINWGTTGGQVCVTANNACGMSPQACFDVTVNDVPATPETLPNVTVCANTTEGPYTVTPVLGADTYTWTVPGGSSVSSGQNSNSVEIDFGTTGGQVCVTANNDCGMSAQACFDVTVDEIPDEPTPPMDAIICAGLAGDTYSVADVPGALSYTWTVPAGATIANGQTTNTIDIDWGSATTGEVCITANNDCGMSPEACFDVMIGDVPPMPIPPANSNICFGTANSNYAIAPVADATGYIWTVPGGASITNGDNTTSINVDWGTATTGDICVTATNSCGDGPQACFTVTVDEVPNAPTAPQDDEVCAGTDGSTYSIDDVVGADSYTWTVPNGASIVDGLGTTDIEIDWADNATTGDICVTADNDCGMSQEACFTVTINDVPGAATVPGPATICENLQGDTYSITDVPNADNYTWTVPGGASIANGQNSTSIDIDWGTTGGDVCVTPSNACGDGPETCFTITVNTTPQAPIAPQNATICQGTNGDVYSVNPVAGATGYTWTVPGNATITNGVDTDEITVDWGTATSGQICVTANNDCGMSPQACFDVTIDEIPDSPVAPADDAVCAGTLDAAYSILPVTGADTYTWSVVGDGTIASGQNTTNITVDYGTGTDATICVTADNDCGSSDPVCFTTTINPIPTADFTVETPICNDGTSTITYTGTASTNATYTWNFNGGTNTTGASGAGPYVIEWNAAGDYTLSLTVSENTCESEPVSMNVAVEAPLAIPVINCNTTTSSIEFTWADIPGATGYLVDNVPNPGTTYEVTGLSAGQSVTIIVTALGDGPCGNSEAEQTCIAEDCPMVDIVIDAVAPICLDANTGTITLNAVVSGSAGTGSGEWSGTGITDATLGTFDPNAGNIGNNAVTYTYTEGPCMYSESIDIEVNSQPTADFIAPSPICAEDTVTVNYTGTATATATYTWDFGNADYIDGTGAGPYEIHWPAGANQDITLTVTSLSGCPSEEFSQTVVIDAPLATPDITCVSSTDNIVFSWPAIPGAVEYLVNNIEQPGTSFTAAGLNAGDMVTITVIAVGNGSCGNSQATQTCTADDCPPVTLDIDPVDPICLDATAVAFNLNIVVGGAGTGQWQGPGIVDADAGLFDPNAPTVTSGINTVTYFYQDGACTDEESIEIIVNPQPEATFTVDPEVCAGDNVTVSFTGTFNAVATYVWDFGNGTVVMDLGQETYEVQMPITGTETITLQVIENNCASEIASENVQVDEPLALPVISCVTTTTSITFNWDAIPGANGYTVNGVPQGGTSFTVSGLNTGDSETITVVALGSGACGNSEATQTCTAENCPPDITVDIDAAPALCQDPATAPINLNAVVTGGNGGSGLWSGTGITDPINGEFDPNAVGVVIGVNTITYTYAEPPCEYTGTIDIIVNEVPSSAFSMDATACIGDEVTVTYDGVFAGTATYNWNFGNGIVVADLGQETYTIQFPVGGSQDVTLTVENNGCTSAQQVETIQVDEPLADPVILCEPTLNSVNFTWAPITGATGYIVNGTLQTETNFEFTGLNQGDIVNITVIAVGNGPCGNSESMETCEASDCDPIMVTIDPVAELCIDGATVDLNEVVVGGTGGTGTWSGTGITDTDNGIFDPTAAGVIIGSNQVVYTYSEGGCDYPASIDITVNGLPSAAFSIDPVACIGDDVTVTYLGAFDATATYDWNFGNGIMIADLGNETYTIQFPVSGTQDVTLDVINNGCNSGQELQSTQVDEPLPLPNITCTPTLTSVDFTWDAIPGVTNYIVNGTSQTATSFEFTGLAQGDVVNITVIAVGTGPCGNSEAMETCEASDCPPVNLVIDPVTDICETDTPTGIVNLNVTITGSTGTGNGTWSGTGILDPVAGTFDPNNAALISGANTVTFTFMEDGCMFSDDLQINVYDQPSANAGPTSLLSCANNNETTLTGSGSGNPMWSGGTFSGSQDIFNPVVTSSGIYTLTVTDPVSGCTNTSTVEITADPSDPVAISNGNLILDCNNNTTVTLQADGTLGANYQVTWNGPGINAGNENDESITLDNASQAGDYSFIITDTNLMCDSEPAFISVGLDTLPPNAIIQFTGSLDCNFTGAILSTNDQPNTTVTWEDPEGTITAGNQLEVFTPGEYILYVVNDINGCDNFSTFLVEDNVAYPIADAGADQVLDCTASSVSLDGSNSQLGATIIYTWTTVNGAFDGPTDQLTATAVAPGTYILTTLDSSNDCTQNDEVIVTADLNSPVAEAGDDVIFGCTDESVSLSGAATTGANAYEWTDVSGTVISSSVNVDVTETGIYYLSVLNTDNDCDALDSVIVSPTTNLPSGIETLISQPTCFGEVDGYFNVTEVQGGTAPYTYSIDGEIFNSLSQFSFLAGNTTYDLTIEDDDGCLFNTEIFIPEPAQIPFNLPDSLDIYLGDSISLGAQYANNTGTIDTIIWSPLEFLECPDSSICFFPETAENFQYTTTVSAIVVDTFGCSVRDEVLVIVNKERPIYIPNAFSPNNDGTNELFQIYEGTNFNSGVDRVNFFRVFNRWGEIVYEEEFFKLSGPDSTPHGWDGRFKGKQLNPGVYVYVAEVLFVDGFKILYKGDVTIMR